MRLISPVAIDEVFQSGGVYLYYRDESLIDITEAWTIHRTADGRTVTRVERNAPAFGVLVLVEARTAEDTNDLEQIEVHWWNSTQGAVGIAAASYTVRNGVIDGLRWVDGSELIREFVLTPPTLVVSPLMRVFLGSVLPKVAEMGEATVFVPWIDDPSDPEKLLSIDLERRTARPLAREKIHVEGAEFNTTRYSYAARTQEDDDASFWLNDESVLVRYLWNGWDVHLAEYRTEQPLEVPEYADEEQQEPMA